MASKRPTARGVETASEEYIILDKNGKPTLNPRLHFFARSRAKQPVLFWHLLTKYLALDIEFQRVKIAGRDKQVHRIGRLTVINKDGEVIYDVFVWYPELHGHTKTLSARWRRLGVYWEDIQIENGAVPVGEVEQNLRAMLEGRIVIGHAIENDIKVCSPFVWEGIEIRNTQKHKYYQQLLGIRQPGLARLAPHVVGHAIQGKEHCSCEDGCTTLALWKYRRGAMEEEQAGWIYRGAATEEEDLDFGDADFEDTYYEDEENEAIREELTTYAAELAKMPLPDSSSFWQAGAAQAKQSETTSYNIQSTPKVTTQRRQPTSTAKTATK
ncbi:RNA exonuclease 4 [Fulvia fulva]|uniref:RNA exonuclease 4 n=1 Tax=Passalora fulva TaxID=5499 RepID=A0A9Q8P8H0_PASFU|nr:RNA exonuclease 4 [Fulvia fulva]UJO16876.1 RNA exonuclease 4 [Fulvia fulva]